MPEPKVANTVRLSPETWAALKTLAAKQRRSLNNFIEDALETMIDVQEGWPE